jgi:uncharacterized damage-inducible protein DinB
VDLQDLQNLIDYHFWARDRVLEAVEALTPEQFTRDMGSSFRSIRDTLAHVYFADRAWLLRWQGQSPTAFPSFETFPDVATLRAAWTDLEARVRSFVDGMDEAGVGIVYEYRFMSGQPAASALWQMLQHVVNHATYHRGQVTTMLRQLGAAPARSVDLITFYRERG